MTTGSGRYDDRPSENYPDPAGDNIQLGDINNAAAVAIGRGARATLYQGLTIEKVAALVVELQNQDQPTIWDGRTPYLGLNAFQESDAEFFFGREGLVDELLERVERTRFVTIAGPSGSGKSSMARAGLFHALRKGRLERSDTWLLATMQPRDNPLEQLALAIERMEKKPDTADYIREHGWDDPLALHKLAETLLTDDKRQRFVLLVDQFEEVFAQTRDEAERSAFIDLLTAAAKAAEGRAMIAISLRSDFISNCAVYPELRNLLSEEFQLVGAMAPQDLARAITLPSLEVGAEIEPALVKQIMDDMKGEPGALPLMSFALQALFDAEKTAKSEAMDLTLQEYLQRGGIESALERHANEVFSSFSAEQKALARGIFTSLITVSEGRVDTRRTATFEELVRPGTSRELVAATVAALAEEDARLITTSVAGDEPITNLAVVETATVTIAHEKLIDAWPWLRRLVDENRESIKLQNDVATAARTWEEYDQDSSYLYSGARLENVEEYMKNGQLQLAGYSDDFITASINRRESNVRNRMLLMSGLGALAIIAVLAALFAFRFAGQADDNAAEAQANLVTAEAEKQRAETQSTRALAAESTAVAEATRAFENQLQAEIESTRAFENQEKSFIEATRASFNEEQAVENAATAEFQARLTLGQGLVNAADAVSLEEPVLAAQLALEAEHAAQTGATYASIHRYVPHSVRSINKLVHGAAISGAAWNKDQSRLLTWAEDGTVKLWQAGVDLPIQVLSHDGAVNGARWNSDESMILTWSGNDFRRGSAKVWKVGEETPLQVLSHNSRVNGAVWNSEEDLILTWSGDTWLPGGGQATLWQIGEEEPIQTFEHDISVWGATWNNDESLILTWDRGGVVKMWELGNETPVRILSDEDGAVNGVTWNSDGSLIMTWGFGGTANIWDANSDSPVLTLFHNDVVQGATWNKDEGRILTWSGNPELGTGSAKVWGVDDISSAESQFPMQTLSHEGPVLGAIWSEDESLILTWSSDGTAKVWEEGSQSPREVLVHEGPVYGATWNEDESLILTWGEDGVAKVWEEGSESPREALTHDGAVLGANWNQDESRILTWSADGLAEEWELQDNLLQQTMPHEDLVLGALWNEDESRILTWSWDGTAKVWEEDSDLPVQILTHDAWVNGATWNEDETQILTWSWDGTAKVWEEGSEMPRLTLTHEDIIVWATWNSDESQILTWSSDGTARLWDAANGSLLQTLRHETLVFGATWSEDENLILTWSYDGTAKVWEVGRESPKATLVQADPSRVTRIGASWNEDDSLIYTWGEDGTAKVWDAGSEIPLQTMAHDGAVYGVVWNEDESLILTWSRDGTAKLWEQGSETPLQTMAHDGAVVGAVWNEDESLILTWSFDGTAKIWEKGSEGPLQTMAHDGEVLGAAWNEDETLILTWSQDGTAKLWEQDSESPLQTMAHDGALNGAIWNNDESLILTTGIDGKVKIWQVDTGREVVEIEGDGAPILSMKLSADESKILLTTKGNEAFIYRLKRDQLWEISCQALPFNFRWNDWQRYFPDQPYRCTCKDLPPHSSVLQAPGAVIDEASCPLMAEVGSEELPFASQK